MSRISDEELRRLLKHTTPGPWRMFGKKSGKVISENAPGFVEVCEAGDFRDRELVPFNGDRWNADAALIALAPALAAEVLQLRDACAPLTMLPQAPKDDGLVLVPAEDVRRICAALSTPSPVVAKEGRDA